MHNLFVCPRVMSETRIINKLAGIHIFDKHGNSKNKSIQGGDIAESFLARKFGDIGTFGDIAHFR